MTDKELADLWSKRAHTMAERLDDLYDLVWEFTDAETNTDAEAVIEKIESVVQMHDDREDRWSCDGVECADNLDAREGWPEDGWATDAVFINDGRHGWQTYHFCPSCTGASKPDEKIRLVEVEIDGMDFDFVPFAVYDTLEEAEAAVATGEVNGHPILETPTLEERRALLSEFMVDDREKS